VLPQRFFPSQPITRDPSPFLQKGTTVPIKVWPADADRILPLVRPQATDRFLIHVCTVVFGGPNAAALLREPTAGHWNGTTGVAA
jgi:hypothetical protein